MSLVEALCIGLLAIPGLSDSKKKYACDNYVPIIASASLENNVDPTLMLAVMYVESSYRKRAVSHAGACGLMQILPKYSGVYRKGTRRPYTCDQLKSPNLNINLGVRIYAKLLALADGNENKALCYYNAGPVGCPRVYRDNQGRIDKSKYVKKVRKIQKYILSSK